MNAAYGWDVSYKELGWHHRHDGRKAHHPRRGFGLGHAHPPLEGLRQVFALKRAEGIGLLDA